MPQTIFISPHHDDVCFSLAGSVLGCPGSHLVNVFTQSDYAVAQVPPIEGRRERIRLVTSLRASEDRAFADACHLTRHDLLQQEPPLLGIHPFDLGGLARQADHLDTVLIRHVIGLGLGQAHTRSKPALYCPMGIGGHRDHVAVLLSVLQAMPELSRLFELHFYEDLHYASRADDWQAGLLRFSGLLKGIRLGRKVIELSPEIFSRKMSLVRLYASQHECPPRASEYVPASVGYRLPHEAVWTILH